MLLNLSSQLEFNLARNLNRPTLFLFFPSDSKGNFQYHHRRLCASIIIQKNWKLYLEKKNNKTPKYFSMMQSYPQHSGVPSAPLHTYSFALYPESRIPSGYYNPSVVNTFIPEVEKFHYS